MRLRLLAAVLPFAAFVALALSGCGSVLPGSPSPSVGPFTADQVRDCSVVNATFGRWPDFAMPGDMSAARTALAAELDKDITITQYLQPAAAQAEWDALVEAMMTARPALREGMTRAEFEAVYARVQQAGNALYEACLSVTDWGKANPPQ